MDVGRAIYWVVGAIVLIVLLILLFKLVGGVV